MFSKHLFVDEVDGKQPHDTFRVKTSDLQALAGLGLGRTWDEVTRSALALAELMVSLANDDGIVYIKSQRYRQKDLRLTVLDKDMNVRRFANRMNNSNNRNITYGDLLLEGFFFKLDREEGYYLDIGLGLLDPLIKAGFGDDYASVLFGVINTVCIVHPFACSGEILIWDKTRTPDAKGERWATLHAFG